MGERQGSLPAGRRQAQFNEDNNWARPVLQRMKESADLEGDMLGRYRVKPDPRTHKDSWISPDIEKILRESGVKVDSERADAAAGEDSRATRMLAALLTTLLFAISAICGYRTAKQVGGVEANFWRITMATILLAAWAFTFGRQFEGAPGWFMLSGFFGIGLGDSAYFQALPRLGQPAHRAADAMSHRPVCRAHRMAMAGHPVALGPSVVRGRDSRRGGHRAGARGPFKNIRRATGKSAWWPACWARCSAATGCGGHS